MSGIDLINEERVRQVNVLGYDAKHDAKYDFPVHNLTTAADCLLQAEDDSARVPDKWPWNEVHWKPKDKLRNLVRAGALYLAAYDAIADWHQFSALEKQTAYKKVEQCADQIDTYLESN